MERLHIGRGRQIWKEEGGWCGRGGDGGEREVEQLGFEKTIASLSLSLSLSIVVLILSSIVYMGVKSKLDGCVQTCSDFHLCYIQSIYLAKHSN